MRAGGARPQLLMILADEVRGQHFWSKGGQVQQVPLPRTQVGRRQSWPFSDWKGWESRSAGKRTGVKQSVVLILLFSLTLSIIGDGDRNLLRLLRSHRDPADQSYKDIPRILWTCRSCKSLNCCSVLCHGLTKYFNKFNFINYIKVNVCKNCSK